MLTIQMHHPLHILGVGVALRVFFVIFDYVFSLLLHIFRFVIIYPAEIMDWNDFPTVTTNYTKLSLSLSGFSFEFQFYGPIKSAIIVIEPSFWLIRNHWYEYVCVCGRSVRFHYTGKLFDEKEKIANQIASFGQFFFEATLTLWPVCGVFIM